MSPRSPSNNEVTNTVKRLVAANRSIEKTKNEIRTVNSRLEQATNKSSNTYKNGLKLRDKLKNKLKEQNNTKKEYLSIICSQNMINELNNRIKTGENVLKCPSNYPELKPNIVRYLNRLLKKDVSALRNELRRKNSKRASTSGRR
jgi:hypothetical protein